MTWYGGVLLGVPETARAGGMQLKGCYCRLSSSHRNRVHRGPNRPTTHPPGGKKRDPPPPPVQGQELPSSGNERASCGTSRVRIKNPLPDFDRLRVQTDLPDFDRLRVQSSLPDFDDRLCVQKSLPCFDDRPHWIISPKPGLIKRDAGSSTTPWRYRFLRYTDHAEAATTIIRYQ